MIGIGARKRRQPHRHETLPARGQALLPTPAHGMQPRGGYCGLDGAGAPCPAGMAIDVT